MMKKGLFAASVIGIAAMAGTLVGCDGAETGKQGFLKSPEDAFAFSAVSGVSLLSLDSGAQNAVLSYFSGAAPMATVVESPDRLEEQLEEVVKYINMFEGMLGTGALNTVTEADVVYQEVEYAVKSTVTVSNLDGTTTTYVMYYNETPADEKTEPQDEQEDEEEEETREVESVITGVMTLGGTDYAIEGKKELDGEETEVEFTALAADGTRILVEQEIEAEEQSFAFKLYDAEGKLLQESEVELETEADEVEFELKLKDAEGKVQKYAFEKETEDGETLIKVKYPDETGKQKVAKVKVVTDENGQSKYVFHFEDGKEQTADRDKVTDEDDED